LLTTGNGGGRKRSRRRRAKVERYGALTGAGKKVQGLHLGFYKGRKGESDGQGPIVH
jgi:hypothetical protein